MKAILLSIALVVICCEASNFNKLNRISEIANLINNAFRSQQESANDPSDGKKNQILMGFLKLFGFDSAKISAITINGLIFLAQLVGTSLIHKKEKGSEYQKSESIDSENPFNWVLENSEIFKLISMITDRKLPEYTIEYVKDHSSTEEENGCVQQMICKISPFIWGMQRALTDTKNSIKEKKLLFDLFEYIPNVENIKMQSELCQQKYRLCIF
ncbi:hypothetical protein ABEB36_005266 [Hypothenemus hampei]|uniref:Uncharacterized protein n=1 Tax=Hypothenemus hampei TaxID=57062 RepID=A0ABD1EXM0_HYPHA